MRRRRSAIQLFGVSFLDVLACALGAVVFLLMQTANRAHEEAEVYSAKIEGLDEDVSGLKGELALAIKGLRGAEDERDRAIGRAEEAEGARDAAERARAKAEAEAAEHRMAKEEADKARGEAERKAAKAQKEKEEAEKEREKAVATTAAARKEEQAANERAKKAEAELAGLKRRLGEVVNELSGIRTELATAQRQLAQLRGVVGLKGDLENVVFVFDTSGSLGQSELSKDSPEYERDRARKLRRFEEYKTLLSGWIEALDFKTFNVISFNTNAHLWRKDSMVPATEANRRGAIALVKNWKPGGTTNTMQALEDTLSLPKVDTVVIFSDGQPNDASNKPVYSNPPSQAERARSQAAVRRVMEEVAAMNMGPDGKPKVTINAVAMGDYLDRDYGRFLQQLARKNGGEFIGR